MANSFWASLLLLKCIYHLWVFFPFRIYLTFWSWYTKQRKKVIWVFFRGAISVQTGEISLLVSKWPRRREEWVQIGLWRHYRSHTSSLQSLEEDLLFIIRKVRKHKTILTAESLLRLQENFTTWLSPRVQATVAASCCSSNCNFFSFSAHKLSLLLIFFTLLFLIMH